MLRPWLSNLRNSASRLSVCEALKQAKGVWFGGGRQWRFVDAYDETKAIYRFRDVLRRGGVIGGSSAGATIPAIFGSAFSRSSA